MINATGVRSTCIKSTSIEISRMASGLCVAVTDQWPIIGLVPRALHGLFTWFWGTLLCASEFRHMGCTSDKSGIVVLHDMHAELVHEV